MPTDFTLFPLADHQPILPCVGTPKDSSDSDGMLRMDVSTGVIYHKQSGKFQNIGTVGGGGGATGTVTSVGLTAPAELTVGNSPVSVSGNLSLSWAAKAANLVFAGPTSGGNATPAFRALALADLPALPVMGASGASHAAGQVPDPGASSGTTRYLREDGTWVVPPVGSGGSTTLAGLTDTNVSEGSGIDGYSLVWNNSTGKWTAVNVTAGGGGAVGIGSLNQFVEQFTAGGTDDTTQLNNAFAWVTGGAGRVLSFTPGKTYIANGTLTVNGGNKFTIDGRGATIQAKVGMANTTNLSSFTSNTDFEVRDLFIDGNRANRTPLESTCHNVVISNSNVRGAFRRVWSDNACCDGFYVNNSAPTVLASSPTDIRFYGCRATNCYRNNMSLINSNRFRDYDGIYDNAVGTAPQAGVDVEPNATNETGNIDARFYNTRMRGNAGYGLSVVSSNSSVKAYDIDSSGNTLGAVTVPSGGNLEINNIAMNDYTSSVTRGVIDIGASAGAVKVWGISATNCLTGSDSKPLVYAHATATGPTSIRGLTATGCNCCLVNANSRVDIENVEIISHASTTSAAILLQNGGNSVLRNYRAKGLPCYAWYISAPNCTVDMVRFDDPALNDVLGEFASTASGAVLNDFQVTQSTAVPASQVGVQFDAGAVPARVTNVIGILSGGSYAIANLLKLNGGAVGSIIQNITPGLSVAYTVATLPSSGPLVYDGSTLWCSNARNGAEGAGSGTGSSVVYRTGTGWRIPGVVTAVTA